jgi:hypothetical protein
MADSAVNPSRYYEVKRVRIGAQHTYRNKPKEVIRHLIYWQREISFTEKEAEKVGREEVEVIKHRARQPVDDWSRRIQDEQRGGISQQQASFKDEVRPGGS